VISGFTTELVNVTAPVYNTIGSTVTYVGEVAAQKPINVWVPDEYDTVPTNGAPVPNPQLSAVTINATDVSCSYDLVASVVTPTLFTGNGFGEWAWLQECQIDVTTGGGVGATQMATPELDSSFPHNAVGGPGNGILGTPNEAQADPKGYPVYHLFPDSPTEGWNNSALHPDLALAFNNNFSLYVMYQPPDTGYGVNWVPIDLYQWTFSASMTRPDRNTPWTPTPPGSVVNNGKTAFPSYPYWTSKKE
jgi:hypothetical protein